jgi:hypothetical protein
MVARRQIRLVEGEFGFDGALVDVKDCERLRSHQSSASSVVDSGGHGASTAAVWYPFSKHMRDSGLPSDVLLRKLKKDIRLRYAGTRSPK